MFIYFFGYWQTICYYTDQGNWVIEILRGKPRRIFDFQETILLGIRSLNPRQVTGNTFAWELAKTFLKAKYRVQKVSNAPEESCGAGMIKKEDVL